jgi:hypothetical protein
MKQVNKSLRSDLDPDTIQSYEGGTNHIFFDLGDYVSKACSNASAVASFQSQLARTVATKFSLEEFWSTYINAYHYPIKSFSGLNTSAPSQLLRSSYSQTAWYQATH